MATMSFLINDYSTSGNTPVVQVVITENADGTLTFELEQLAGFMGDLRGFFFDIADETLIGTLAASGVGLTELKQGDDTVVDLGGGANVQGLGGDGSGYDVGLEIGVPGLGRTDDFRTFSFTLDSTARDLTLADVSGMNFAARATSVGLDFNGDGTFESVRNGGSKTGELAFTVISPVNDDASVDEDATLTGNVLENDGGSATDVLKVIGWSGGALDASVVVPELRGAAVTLTADGSFTVDATAADALAEGESVSRTFTYDVLQSDEGDSSLHAASFTVRISGANDAPVITTLVGGNEGAVVEAGNLADGSVSAGTPGAGGTLSASDVDGGATATWSGNATGTYGTFSIDSATGAWTYTLNNSNADTQALADGRIAGESFTATVTDDKGATAAQVVTVAIVGANDAPIVGGQATGTVTEDVTTSVSGKLTISDPDAGQSSFQAQSGIAGTFGSLNVNASGDWTYFLNNSLAAVQALNAGQTLKDSVNILTADGTAQPIAITIQGTPDALDGWQLFQPGATAGSGFVTLSPFGSTPNDSLVHSFLATSLSPDLIGHGNAMDGAAAKTTVTVGASTYLKFTYSFTGSDAGSSLYRDFSYVSVDGNSFLLKQFPGAVTGLHAAIPLSAGTHTIGFAAFDLGDTLGTPTLSASDIRIGSAADPIVLDIDGDGVHFVGGTAAVNFDLDADGRPEQIAWVSPQDGMLVTDLDGSGAIEDGTEVLSENFAGFGFGSSMDALRSLDINLDGKVDAADSGFAALLVWRDANGDGVSQGGELLSFDELGITAVSVQGDSRDEIVDGQQVYAAGTLTYASGAAGAYAAVHLSEVVVNALPTGWADAESIFGDGAGAAAESTALSLAMLENALLRQADTGSYAL